MSGTLPDGLIAMREVIQLSEVMRLIEQTARWVDPETFRLLPMWYPEYARRTYFYKKNWSEPQMNRNRKTGHTEHKREGNRYARKALTHALGLRSDDPPNWSCCHIWGIDDVKYQEANAIVQDRRFFSCVANMVYLPTPLKAFTDTMPEVKAMLRICARHLYDWHCDHNGAAEGLAIVEAWTDWSAYPPSWPRADRTSVPLGVVKIDKGIRQSITRRLQAIRKDLKDAGDHYPRKEVRQALADWNIKI